MIAYLQGSVLAANSEKAIILTNVGVGYDVYTVTQLIKNDLIELYISTIFRDSGTELFAFTDLGQKALFEFLLLVNGVGPKSAFSIIKNLGPSRIVSAILEEDEITLKSVPGVGSKTAKQIILDLKSKVEKDPTLKGMLVTADIIAPNSEQRFKHSIPNNVALEIRFALKELGFKDQEIQKKFLQYQYQDGVNVDQVLKEMLKN